MSFTPTASRFEGKSALITGAASGIGQATALRLAAEGARVFAVDVAADRLAKTVESAAGLPGEIVPRVTDVTDRAECFAAVADAVAAHGRLDILGNIAGIARAEHVLDVSEADYRRMMAVNTDACFFLAQAAIPHLLETGGNVVNVASNAGLMGQAYTVAYCMSKGALVQMTRSLAWEFIKTPLRVNAIAPGGVETALVSGFQVPPDVDFDLMMRYGTPRPMAQAEDVAALFCFVASDEARNINGAVLSTDSGVTAG
jgi:meso-butanediol dehydrogenase/(S,S)-butanediol dehydrogenase/diacetyl reductase